MSAAGHWNYLQYGEGVLKRAAEMATREGNNLKQVTCNVREETDHRRNSLTQEAANKYNKNMLGICKGLGKYIKNYLITERLKADDDRLQRHERALHVMVHEGVMVTDNDLAWMAKLSQMFIEQCIVGFDPVKEDGLKDILRSVSITNPIHPQTNDVMCLSGALAFQQQLTISHINHLQGGGYFVYDCNPKNSHLENHATNVSKRSCGRFFWIRACQCDKRCQHRCVLLDRKRYEYEVQTQLVMCCGFWPSACEAEIRSNIRDKFIAHHTKYEQVLPEYLSDAKKDDLLRAQYPELEGLRRRFDMNKKGPGILCPRQGRVTFMEVLRGTKDIPKGLLQFLDHKLRALKPVKAKVVVTRNDANADRSVPGSYISQDCVDKENLWQFQRILAMSNTLKMIVKEEFVFDHPEMSQEERAVDSLLYSGKLDAYMQMIGFKISDGLRNGYLRNDYLEGEGNKRQFHVSLARLLKTVQIYFDQHDDWLEMSTGEDAEQDDWLEMSTSDGAASDGAGEDGEERNCYADPQLYLEHTSIRSPTNGTPLTPQLASAQVLNASHTTHPVPTRHTNPIEGQMGGDPRDANPDNVVKEEEPINVCRSICAIRPSIPCMNECMCHPDYPCKAVLSKLDEKYVNQTVLMHSQLGPHGRYPDANGDISTIQQEVLQEVKLAYTHQGVDVPEFVGIQEEYGAFLIYNCNECGKEYRTLEEANHCCSEQQQVSNEDNRVIVGGTDFNDNEVYQAEVLRLVKEWGAINRTMIMKKTSFKFQSEKGLTKQITKISDRSPGPFARYCEDNNVQFDILTKCSGKRFGCTCQLHDERDDDEVEEEL
eukprot:scaffold2944_cov155-Skeletonema_dohrnii-CCMP3373.AAC.25